MSRNNNSSPYKCIFLVNESQPEGIHDKRVLEMMNAAERICIFEKGTDALLCLMQPGNVPEIVITSEKIQDMPLAEFLNRYENLPEWVNGFCKVYLLLPPLNKENFENKYEHKKINKVIYRPVSPAEFNGKQNNAGLFLS